jgi:hypothetical protein
MRDAKAREHAPDVFAGPSSQGLAAGISHSNILPDHLSGR